MKIFQCFSIILFMLFFFCVNSHAMQATTVGGYCACFTESDLDDMTSFASSNDMKSFDAYIKWKRCIVVKSGLTVTIIKSPGILGGKTQFAFEGIKFWTVREALKDYR